jgi:hypothetical protein
MQGIWLDLCGLDLIVNNLRPPLARKWRKWGEKAETTKYLHMYMQSCVWRLPKY